MDGALLRRLRGVKIRAPPPLPIFATGRVTSAFFFSFLRKKKILWLSFKGGDTYGFILWADQVCSPCSLRR